MRLIPLAILLLVSAAGTAAQQSVESPDVVTITDQVVDAFLRGHEVERALTLKVAALRKDAEVARDPFMRAMMTYTECNPKVVASREYQDALAAMFKMPRPDKKEQARLEAQPLLIMVKRCGEFPELPSESRQLDQALIQAQAELTDAPAKAAGWNPRQYDSVRDRITWWLRALKASGGDPKDPRMEAYAGTYKMNTAERAVMTARRAALLLALSEELK